MYVHIYVFCFTIDYSHVHENVIAIIKNCNFIVVICSVKVFLILAQNLRIYYVCFYINNTGGTVAITCSVMMTGDRLTVTGN